MGPFTSRVPKAEPEMPAVDGDGGGCGAHRGNSSPGWPQTGALGGCLASSRHPWMGTGEGGCSEGRAVVERQNILDPVNAKSPERNMVEKTIFFPERNRIWKKIIPASLGPPPIHP